MEANPPALTASLMCYCRNGNKHIWFLGSIVIPDAGEKVLISLHIKGALTIVEDDGGLSLCRLFTNSPST